MRIPENIVILASIMSNITEFLQDADMVILFGEEEDEKIATC